MSVVAVVSVAENMPFLFCCVCSRQVASFECAVDGDSLTCRCRYVTDEDTAKAKKGFHDLEVRVCVPLIHAV